MDAQTLSVSSQSMKNMFQFVVFVVCCDAPVLVAKMKILCSGEQHHLSNRFVNLKVDIAATAVVSVYFANAKTFYVFLHAGTNCEKRCCQHHCPNSYYDLTGAGRDVDCYLAYLTNCPIALTCLNHHQDGGFCDHSQSLLMA